MTVSHHELMCPVQLLLLFSSTNTFFADCPQDMGKAQNTVA